MADNINRVLDCIRAKPGQDRPTLKKKLGLANNSSIKCACDVLVEAEFLSFRNNKYYPCPQQKGAYVRKNLFGYRNAQRVLEEGGTPEPSAYAQALAAKQLREEVAQLKADARLLVAAKAATEPAPAPVVVPATPDLIDPNMKSPELLQEGTRLGLAHYLLTLRRPYPDPADDDYSVIMKHKDNAANNVLNTAAKIEDMGLRRQEASILPKLLRRFELERVKLADNLTEQQALDQLGFDASLDDVRGQTIEHVTEESSRAATFDQFQAIKERLQEGQDGSEAEDAPVPPQRPARPCSPETKGAVFAPSPPMTPQQTEEQRRIADSFGFKFNR